MAQVGNYLNSNALSLILNEVCPTNLICLTKDAGNPAMFIIHQIGCTCRWGGGTKSHSGVRCQVIGPKLPQGQQKRLILVVWDFVGAKCLRRIVQTILFTELSGKYALVI